MIDLARASSMKILTSKLKSKSSLLQHIDSDSDYSDGSDEDDQIVIENNRFQEFIDIIRFYLALENIKAFFQWLTEHAKIEIWVWTIMNDILPLKLK